MTILYTMTAVVLIQAICMSVLLISDLRECEER